MSVKGGNQGEAIYVFDEPVILDMVTFSTPTGQNVSNIDVCCPADGGGGGQGDPDPGRDCLPNSTTAYVGFEWWVPRDVGSEIQTDSMSFDIGFYTEQCRHNDGSGFGNAGGEPDDDDGVDGDDAISFLAACVDESRSGVGDVTLMASVVAGSDPTEVSWNTNVPVDAVVAYQDGRFTTYTFTSPKASGTVEVGADGGNAVTTVWKPPQDRTETGQTPSDPCPEGYTKGDKVEF